MTPEIRSVRIAAMLMKFIDLNLAYFRKAEGRGAYSFGRLGYYDIPSGVAASS